MNNPQAPAGLSIAVDRAVAAFKATKIGYVSSKRTYNPITATASVWFFGCMPGSEELAKEAGFVLGRVTQGSLVSYVMTVEVGVAFAVRRINENTTSASYVAAEYAWEKVRASVSSAVKLTPTALIQELAVLRDAGASFDFTLATQMAAARSMTAIFLEIE